jgi:hypothetical protein
MNNFDWPTCDVVFQAILHNDMSSRDKLLASASASAARFGADGLFFDAA